MPTPETPKAQETPKTAPEPVVAPSPAATPPAKPAPAPAPTPKPAPVPARAYGTPPPTLNPLYSAAIVDLTGKGRTLYTEMTTNARKIAELQERNVAIRQELTKIEAEVRENAWGGSPLPKL